MIIYSEVIVEYFILSEKVNFIYYFRYVDSDFMTLGGSSCYLEFWLL